MVLLELASTLDIVIVLVRLIRRL